MESRTLLAGLIAAGMLALSACSSAAPREIASYPAPTPVAREPNPPAAVVPYDADFVFVVADVDLAASQATQLASEQGGYTAGSQSWFQDGYKQFQLELSVPAARYNSLRLRLFDLGILVSERVQNDGVSPDDASGRMTQVSVHLQPAAPAYGFDLGWSPVRTFMSAFNVVASIFRVVANIVIWVVVVIGPFALIGLVIGFILRRTRRAA